MTDKKRTVTTLTQTRVDSLVRQPGTAEHSDPQTPGLYLRQSAKGATRRISVMHQKRRHQFKFGSPPTINLAVARKIANAGISRIHMGYELNARWLDEQLVANGIQAAPAAVASVPRVRAKTWLYEEGVEAYLKSLGGGVRREATIRSYGHTLRNPALHKALKGKSIVDIDRRTVASVLADMGKAGKYAMAEAVCRIVKGLWGFMASDYASKESGITENVMLALKPPRRPESAPRGHTVVVPEIAQVGDAVAACRSGVLHPTVSAALEFLILTLQRRETIAGAKIDEMRLDGPTPYWDIGGDRMKGRQGHAIPLHGRALEIVQNAVEAARQSGSIYVFPEARPARTHIDHVPGHIGVSVLTHDLKDISGITPHRLRHAFTSVLLDMEEEDEDDDGVSLALGRASLILDHREGRKSVTAKFYDFAHRLRKKSRILAIWTDLLAKPIQEAVDRFDPVSAKAQIQAARRARQKTKKKSESLKNRESLAKYREERREEEVAHRVDVALINQVLEEHRTGHISDEAALTSLRLMDIVTLVAHRIVLGHDLAERPDLATAVEAAYRRYPSLREDAAEVKRVREAA
ncbi:tyrosine-type recombinase/integrase [Aureimonas sp. Leaf324]|uniref:tyrosine-type recombinase/integrase n=1 Tax=Aureimonas sp. Leaf324 TaxID=1736336 RepID=UPI0006F6409A|nr:tyrosine-type recombinase/integrase [Aureimonas sp. Leaf324]KQQ90962.1 hypothetical protein ASF65_00005 [Aureimonas sp. Leaf324]